MTNHVDCRECGEGADRPRRGYCGRCYFRWWRKNPDAITRMSETERYWSKVTKGPSCWEWQGGGDAHGYGRLRWRGQVRPATHAALDLAGRPRPEGTEACHRCDNPPCVNPAHLYWGTRQDNIDDAYARGRRAGGERHAAARLTEAQVVALREAFAAGIDRGALARQYGLQPKTVNDIAAGRKWPNAAGPLTHRKKIRKAA